MSLEPVATFVKKWMGGVDVEGVAKLPPATL